MSRDWCPSRAFVKWLFSKASDDKCEDEIEVDKRNLAQSKQVVESSRNQVHRAIQKNEHLNEAIKSTKQGLDNSLDQLARRLHKLQRYHEEEG